MTTLFMLIVGLAALPLAGVVLFWILGLAMFPFYLVVHGVWSAMVWLWSRLWRRA